MTRKMPSIPTSITCPHCNEIVPYEDRCFIDYSWTNEDGTQECDFTECCEDCHDKYA